MNKMERLFGWGRRRLNVNEEHNAELSLEEAVERAVDECMKEGILSEFLMKNRAEVISMSIFEYDKDEEEKKLRKAEYEAGIEAGRKDTLKQIIKKKLEKGKSVEEIAEELEEDVTVIRKLIDEIEEE